MISARAMQRAGAAGWDPLPVALAFVHAAALLMWPSIPIVGIGLWWNANTVSHQFIHRPFFRSRNLNAAFSIFLSVLLGFPQSFWRVRHLEHHRAIEGGATQREIKMAPIELVAVIALWGLMLVRWPWLMLSIYLPGFVIGLGLCFLQGRYEHRPKTTSHYGRLYNFLMFNDGYHVEHHERPGAHWKDLPLLRAANDTGSRWPPVLRWLDYISLCGLEQIVLRSALLQRFVIRKHERAFMRLLRDLPRVHSVAIIGGGLFPRTALILGRLLPESTLTIVDQNHLNLETARRFLPKRSFFINERWEPNNPGQFDLLVVPLAFEGDRASIYSDPPAKFVLVHDWLWRRRGVGTIVSLLLLKRLNLVVR
ncbi:MAG: hypothetical protein DMF61_00185 [Blastocatellia bacterium AA13]|nr:MAG: hypothetical protein DMF61_00185 [Blastocatellia bacterium AA13]